MVGAVIFGASTKPIYCIVPRRLSTNQHRKGSALFPIYQLPNIPFCVAMINDPEGDLSLEVG